MKNGLHISVILVIVVLSAIILASQLFSTMNTPFSDNLFSDKYSNIEILEIIYGGSEFSDLTEEILLAPSASGHDQGTYLHITSTDYHKSPSDIHTWPTNVHFVTTRAHFLHTEMHYANTDDHLSDTDTHNVSTGEHLSTTAQHNIATPINPGPIIFKTI